MRMRRRQSGAIAVWFGIALLSLIAALALAIDIGRLYNAQRSLQKQANLAALDAARVVSRCGSSGVPGSAEITAAAQASLARNGVADPAGQFSSWQVETGVVATDAGTQFRRLTPSAIEDADAVRVTLRQSMPAPIMPFLRPDPAQDLAASATATQSALGSLRVGSSLAGLQDGIVNGLLSGLLGGSMNLGVAGYQGLLDVGLTAEQLALALGLSVQDLSDLLALETATPVMSDVLDNLAGQLSGAVSTQVRNSLQELAGETTNDSPVPLGDILGPAGGIAGDVPFVNLGELIMAMAMATHADPDGGITPLPLPIAVGIPGVTQLNSFMQVLEAPQLSGLGRPGETRAQTAQLRVMLRMQLSALDEIENALDLLLLGGLLGSVDATPLNLGVDVDVVNATAWLDRIQCPRAGSPDVVADLSAQTSVADLKLGTFTGAPSDAPAIQDGNQLLQGVTIEILGGLLSEINVNLFLNDSVQVATVSTSPQALASIDEFSLIDQDNTARYWQADVAPAASNNPQTIGSTNILGGATSSLYDSLEINASDPDHPDESSSICLLLLFCVPVGDILDAVLDPVLNLLGSVLATTGGVVDALLDPLLSALGIQVGSATVTMDLVTIDQPRIVTTEVPPGSG